MTEQEILQFFDHIRKTAERWTRTRGCFVPTDGMVDLTEDRRSLYFYKREYGDSYDGEIPLIAFVDFDAGVDEHFRRIEERQRSWEAQEEVRDRHEWERLKQKFEGQ
jgi:hypothetical protein